MQRAARGQQRQALEVAGRLRGHHLHLDLYLAAIARRKQGPHAAVDQAAHQHLVVAEASLASQEVAGDPTDGCELLTVLDCQRQERLVGLGRCGGRDGRQDDVVAAARDDGRGGLAGDAAGLEGQLRAAASDRDAVAGGRGRIRASHGRHS